VKGETECETSALARSMSGLPESGRLAAISRLSQKYNPVIAAIRGTAFMECRRISRLSRRRT
jgi:hypothetical protein